ncbi:ImmA/IrrE family metallo-endopeptidase [Sphingomonas sp. CL5.1]|uniref:ImmA/IrrE family metallo-endopeptidase n=1 Tax=Sphingomonas sp. CL5.1 TaxID=2653203 RepID=UPI0015836211|nr:ImmA/IrrE family metallo-endopeptidase [Sphingomonas sp. CL5.1]QKR99205.1 ImmA/IrrE family metallo-endopeptidase [Sphingomonas sp. CL5.1]
MSLLSDNRVREDDADVVRRFTAEFPVKVGELASELGLKVTRAPLLPKISGLIQPSSDARSGFEIRVNKYEIPERQRFTVAHEISHYLLHRDDIGSGVVDSIMYRSNLTSRKETEANRLAADIVMPARAVSRELERLGGRRTDDVVEKLAAMFRVSVPAMKVRLGVA